MNTTIPVQEIYAGLVDLRRKIITLTNGLSHAAPAGKRSSSIEYLAAVVPVVSQAIQAIKAMTISKKDGTSNSSHTDLD